MSPTVCPSPAFSLGGIWLGIRDPVTPWNQSVCNSNSFHWIPHRLRSYITTGYRARSHWWMRPWKARRGKRASASVSSSVYNHRHTSIYAYYILYMYICICMSLYWGLLPRCQKLIFSALRQMLPAAAVAFRGFRRRKVSNVYIKWCSWSGQASQKPVETHRERGRQGARDAKSERERER